MISIVGDEHAASAVRFVLCDRAVESILSVFNLGLELIIVVVSLNTIRL